MHRLLIHHGSGSEALSSLSFICQQLGLRLRLWVDPDLHTGPGGVLCSRFDSIDEARSTAARLATVELGGQRLRLEIIEGPTRFWNADGLFADGAASPSRRGEEA